jgi:hypothetical protein
MNFASPEWLYVTVAGTGLLVAGLTFLVFRFLSSSASAIEQDPEHLRKHSILPEDGRQAPADSDPFLQGGFVERRGAARRKGHAVDVLLSDANGEVEPVQALIIDRSLTGLGLEVWEDGEVEPGTVICVRPKRASAATTWTRVIVRRCKRVRSSWLLGCEFVRVPAGDLRIEFG